jgi:TolB-like protein
VDHGADNDHTRTHVVLTKGTMVSHYRIVEKIGAGGMGEVYLAEDTKLKRKVALKFLPFDLTADPEVRKRFVREAQTIAQLNHPNVITIYEVSEHSGRPYYVMELVEGESLRDISQRKPLPFDMIIEYVIQVCQGLGEAHRSGIVHRDIKSANIAIDKQERIRVLDFGLAATAGEEKLTKTGSTLGTVGYMSPEQVSGREIDHRSDLFSLGVVLYELIAGQTPFKRDNEGATLKAIIEDNPEPLTRYKSDVPDKLQEIVFKLLEKDKELRYQSAEGVIADLKRLMYDSQQTGYTRMSERPKRRGIVIGVTAALVIVVAAVLYTQFRPVSDRSQSVDKVPMIAVLPFENLGAPDDEYFADGMADEVHSRLVGIQQLGVISRNSAMKYKGTLKSGKEIGAELGVEYILTGTVRWNKLGDRPTVRITPQLVRVIDDRPLWAGNYEHELMEVFAVQAEIAGKVIDQLGLTLLESEKQNLANIPTDNPDAYRLYLKAVQVYRYSSDYQGTIDAKPLVDSAVALDSTFALAHALRSDVYANSAGDRPDSEEGRIALESANRALDLEPGLPQAHLALGKYYGWVENNDDRALEHYLLAKSGLDNNALVLSRISSIQMQRGQYEEALANRSKAAELDPLNAKKHSSLGSALMSLRRFYEAEQSFSRAIALEPNIQYYYEDKIECLIAQYGDLGKVIPVVKEALRFCDTTEFVIKNSAVTRYINELQTDSIISAYIQRQRADTSAENLFHDRPFFWFSHLNILEGRQFEAKKQLQFYAMSSEWFIGWRGLLHSFVGECDEAVKCGLRRKEVVSDGEHHDDLASTAMLMARIYANCGKYDEAVNEIDYALSLQTYVTVNSLRLKHWIDPLRDNPRYQELISSYE